MAGSGEGVALTIRGHRRRDRQKGGFVVAPGGQVVAQQTAEDAVFGVILRRVVFESRTLEVLRPDRLARLRLPGEGLGDGVAEQPQPAALVPSATDRTR